jgi:hypothetical protein
VDDRREAESNALLFAIERIDRFKFSRGANAYSYYTAMIFHRILKHCAAARRRDAALFSDIGTLDGSGNGRDTSRAIDMATPYTRAR